MHDNYILEFEDVRWVVPMYGNKHTKSKVFYMY